MAPFFSQSRIYIVDITYSNWTALDPLNIFVNVYNIQCEYAIIHWPFLLKDVLIRQIRWVILNVTETTNYTIFYERLKNKEHA